MAAVTSFPQFTTSENLLGFRLKAAKTTHQRIRVNTASSKQPNTLELTLGRRDRGSLTFASIHNPHDHHP